MKQTCTICGKEIVPFVDARYTIADSEDGTTGEHWKCHEGKLREFDESLNRVKEQSSRVIDILRGLKL